MTIERIDNSVRGNSTIASIYNPGGRLEDYLERQRFVEDELKRKRESTSKHPGGSDPERKPPFFDFGDRHTLRGMLVGGISGAIIGGLCLGFGWHLPMIGLVGGLLLGAFIGAMIGNSIRKRRPRDKDLGVTKEKGPDLGGPFKKV